MTEQRKGYEAFECAPSLRLAAYERVAALQFKQISERLDRIEALIERLERRLWLMVYGVAGAILAQVFKSILTAMP